MSDELQQVIDEFVTRVRAISQKEALEKVKAAFGATSLPPRRGAGRPPRVTRGSATNGGKRDPKELEALVAKLEAAIKSKPGQRIEEIGKALGTSTKELALPAKKLLAAKKIRTTGNRRATKYFPK